MKPLRQGDQKLRNTLSAVITAELVPCGTVKQFVLRLKNRYSTMWTNVFMKTFVMCTISVKTPNQLPRFRNFEDLLSSQASSNEETDNYLIVNPAKCYNLEFYITCRSILQTAAVRTCFSPSGVPLFSFQSDWYFYPRSIKLKNPRLYIYIL